MNIVATGTTLPPNLTVASLVPIGAGSGQAQREGQELRVKYLDYRFSLINVHPTNYHMYRILVYRPKDTSNATDILTSALDVVDVTLFTVKFDRFVDMAPENDNASVIRQFHFRHRVGGSGAVVKYATDLGSSDISGGWYLAIYTNAGAVGDTRFLWFGQTFYKDA